MLSFARWLSTLLNEREIELQRLLADPAAQHFLIAWSLFESKCFDGFLKARAIRGFANRAVQEGFRPTQIAEQFLYFHGRYRGKTGAKALENLLHGDKTPDSVSHDFKTCIASASDTLSTEDQTFVVALVVYRYRNNMFHGAKGVQSWLKYTEQIEHCTSAMQAFISHAESLRPTLAFAEAA